MREGIRLMRHRHGWSERIVRIRARAQEGFLGWEVIAISASSTALRSHATLRIRSFRREFSISRQALFLLFVPRTTPVSILDDDGDFDSIFQAYPSSYRPINRGVHPKGYPALLFSWASVIPISPAPFTHPSHPCFSKSSI